MNKRVDKVSYKLDDSLLKESSQKNQLSIQKQNVPSKKAFILYKHEINSETIFHSLIINQNQLNKNEKYVKILHTLKIELKCNLTLLVISS